MTIALGILASDGLVVAADRQVTVQNYWKGDHGKVSSAAHVSAGHGGGAYLVTGSTSHLPLLVHLNTAIAAAFVADKARPLSEMHFPLEAVVHDFHLKHVLPNATAERLVDVEMIVGAVRHGARRLWSTHSSVVNEHHDFAAVGVGSFHAAGLLQRLWRFQAYDVASAVAMAVFVIRSVARSVDGCGEHPDVLYLRGDWFRRVKHEHVSRLESAFDEYTDEYEPDVLMGVFGGDGGDAKIRSDWRRQQRAIRRCVEQIRSERPSTAAERAMEAAQQARQATTHDPSDQPPSPESPGGSDGP